ncbi:hypothetical protein MW887_008695 [Aspergillus wentii]|nr:hypothetical protein MW887_008695 [Aspergillus wentii]
MHSIMHPETDSSEFELITSPSLYSIRMQESAMGGFRHERIRDYNKYALMRLTSLAPNLKEVHHYANNRRMTRGWEPWSGFTQDENKDTPSLGSLRCLRLCDTIPIEEEFIRDWAAHTDFSKLETLRIETEISQDAMEYLVEECDLSSLKILVLNMATDDVDLVQNHEYYDTARQLLSSLPRLSTLKLIGWHTELPFHTFLEHHGPELRKLSLSVCPTDRLTCFQIARIVDFCPVLEDLELTIPRCRSDITEYTMYKLIGSLECLQRASLTLDASNYDVLWNDGPAETPTDETFDEFDKQFCTVNSALTRHPRNGHVRDAIINSAVDQHLASDIFDAISSGKPDGCLPLEELILRVQGGGKFWSDTWASALDRMVRHFPREWIVKRNQRDDSPSSLVMTEIRQTDDEDEDPLDLPPWLEEIFRRIWPEKREGSKWWEDWASMPLEWPGQEDNSNGDDLQALKERLYSIRAS